MPPALPVSVWVPASQLQVTGVPPEVMPVGPLSITVSALAALSVSVIVIVPVAVTEFVVSAGTPTLSTSPPAKPSSETTAEVMAVMEGGWGTGGTSTIVPVPVPVPTV